MTQLLLDLERPAPPTFDNFVVGANDEAVAVVRRIADDPAAPRFLSLWGDVGSGRSHLLRAACDAHDGSYLDGTQASATAIRAAVDKRPSLLAIDDVETLDATAQEALFHAVNVLRADDRAALIVTGNAAPRDLLLAADRDDLRSRLAWGLVYRLERLDDAQKDAALVRHADQRGFPLSLDVRRYLLTHCPRNLDALMRTIDALDLHAREQRRVLTVPLVREFLQHAQTPSTASETA